MKIKTCRNIVKCVVHGVISAIIIMMVPTCYPIIEGWKGGPPVLAFIEDGNLSSERLIELNGIDCCMLIGGRGDFRDINKDSFAYILELGLFFKNNGDTAVYQINSEGLSVWFEDEKMRVYSFEGPAFNDTLRMPEHRLYYTLICIPSMSPERLARITPKCGADVTIKFDNFIYRDGIPLEIDTIYAKERFVIFFRDEIAKIKR